MTPLYLTKKDSVTLKKSNKIRNIIKTFVKILFLTKVKINGKKNNINAIIPPLHATNKK